METSINSIADAIHIEEEEKGFTRDSELSITTHKLVRPMRDDTEEEREIKIKDVIKKYKRRNKKSNNETEEGKKDEEEKKENE